MNARPEAWLRQAENDLELARLAHQNGYFAQALLELDVEPPHTHVLPDLVTALGRCGLDVRQLDALPLRALSRMAISSRYPLDATPPSELFDAAETDHALATAAAVIRVLRAMDQG